MSTESAVGGVHFAVTIGACAAVVAAVVVLRYLPHEASHESAAEAPERIADPGVGGTTPAFVTEAIIGPG